MNYLAEELNTAMKIIHQKHQRRVYRGIEHTHQQTK